MDKFLDFIESVFSAVGSFIKYLIPAAVGAVISIIIVFLNFGFSGSFSDLMTQVLVSAALGSAVMILLVYLFPKTIGAIFSIAAGADAEVDVGISKE
ncbi:MAG: hypothetical protein ACSHW0_18290 [Thalassotalea sp.]